MNSKNELPQLPDGFRWAVESAGEFFQFGLQSDGLMRNGVIVQGRGMWFWVERTFITVDIDDDDEEIYREMELQATGMRDRLMEVLMDYEERTEKRRVEDEIRQKKTEKVKDFLERNWDGA